MKTFWNPTANLALLLEDGTPVGVPGRQSKMVDLEKGQLVFDSDKLANDPRPRFRELSIGDFDLYCATAYQISRNEQPAFVCTEMKCNRITREFRLRIFGTREGMSWPANADTGNFLRVEYLFDMLNETFCLIDGHGLTTKEMESANWALDDMLNLSKFYYNNYNHSKRFLDEAEIYPHLDVALVLRKMKPLGWDKWNDFDPLLRMARGRRTYATWRHPELLQ